MSCEVVEARVEAGAGWNPERACGGQCGGAQRALGRDVHGLRCAPPPALAQPVSGGQAKAQAGIARHARAAHEDVLETVGAIRFTRLSWTDYLDLVAEPHQAERQRLHGQGDPVYLRWPGLGDDRDMHASSSVGACWRVTMEATLRSDDETVTRPAVAVVVRGDSAHNLSPGKEIVVDGAENRFEHRTRIAKRVVVAEARDLRVTPFQEADAFHIGARGVASHRARSFMEMAARRTRYVEAEVRGCDRSIVRCLCGTCASGARPIAVGFFGAEGENRTRTLLPEPDFESGASTSSATSAWGASRGVVGNGAGARIIR